MHHPLALIAATGVIVLVQTSIVGLGYSPVLGPDTVLAGPDSYMWLLRVEDWWRQGDWYANRVAFANAPYGDVLHWTRPFDLVLLAGALPLSAVMNFRDALLYWGIAVSPVLQFLSVLALSWGTRPSFSNRAFVFLITCEPF